MQDYFLVSVSDTEIKKEKEKARKLRKSQWWYRLRARGVCHYCGRKFPPKELTMDHVIPLIRGGKSTKGNIVAVCKECNTKKKYLLPWEWKEYIDVLNSKTGV